MNDSKYIQIEFASSTRRAVDAVDDIRKAAEHAAVNLYDRFEVRLMVPMVLNSCHYVL